LLHGVSPSKWICELALFTPSGEDYPEVEHGSPTFAATAGSDSKGVSHLLDDIAQANILVAHEPRKARAVGLGFAFGLVLRHDLYLLII
jgi:hypothetical protein